MDQFKDGIPSPSNDQLGLDDRKEPAQKQCSPQEQLSQQEPSLEEPCKQEQSSQQQQDQGMDPLPGQKHSSPQGQFDESPGQTGACSSLTSQIPIPTQMAKPIRRQ
ncbi:MAG: hypothetical protein GY696_11905 [Gammaproteobacteria bacterium]|nr:hypothetical protein [Gammaproteobacteria bacterium]